MPFRIFMVGKKVIWAGLAAGVLCHILQGMAAYVFFDRFYLANPDLIRDATRLVGIYYLLVSLITGLVIAYLAHFLKSIWPLVDWQVGIAAGVLVWAASSLTYVIKRQILLNLSNWLLLEIPADLVIYAISGAVAGYLVGRGIIESKTEAS